MAREPKGINIEVGARIKHLRQELKLTREELAALAGYSSNFIQEVERGRSGLSSESIKAFAVALNVSSDSLLFGINQGECILIARKLSEIPEDKRRHILKILDEIIKCLK